MRRIPETFPKSRAEELLLHLEEVQRRQELAIAETPPSPREAET